MLESVRETEVVRTRSFESRIISQGIPWALRINPKYVGIPDPFIGWYPFAIWHAKRLLRRHTFDAVITTSLPNTCHLVGLWVKRQTGLPWIADFRDAWTQNPFLSYPRLVLGLENRLEAQVIRNADMVTAINDPIRSSLAQKYASEPPEKFVTVEHGYDPADFEGLERTESKALRIVYAGSFYGRRKPDHFLRALAQLLAESPETRERIRVTFVGQVKAVDPLSRDLALQDVVAVRDAVDHREVFRLLRDAEVALLIVGEGRDSRSISTGKVFEYVGSGATILALVPDGMAADLIRSTRAGVVVHPENERGIADALRVMCERHERGDLRQRSDENGVSAFDVRGRVRQFAGLLDTLTQGAGSN